MDKASWVDAFVVQMIELGDKSPRLGQLAEDFGASRRH